MKPVSAAYKASMKGILRNPSHVIIGFGNVDTTAPADGAWAANGVTPWSEFATLDYAYEYDSDPYATLELNRWCGDGSFDLIPAVAEYAQQGYCSSLVADEDGRYTTLPLLARPFSLEHTLPGVTLIFDTICGEWPRKVTVRFMNNGAVAETKVVENISQARIEVNTRAAVIDRIEVQFDEMMPYHRPRVERVIYGIEMEFTDTDVISVKQTHDVDPLSRRLPKEAFSFTIHDYEKNYDPDNPVGIYAFIDTKAPISIKYGYELDDGTVEWLHPDHYVLNGKPKVKDFKATFSGTGLIGSIGEREYYKGTFGQKTFYAMAESVLSDAGLTLTEQGENPWDIDDDLLLMTCDTPIPVGSHMNCLQLIAHACRCRLYTDDDNIIHIKPFGVTVQGIYYGTWETNGEEAYSEWDSVDKGTALGQTYATLELNRWIGDGEQNLTPDDNYTSQGFVSSILSGADGSFTTAPVASRLFQVPHDLPIIKLMFDTRCKEWPRALTIRYWKDGSVVLTEPISSITQEIIVRSDVTDCDSFDLVFTDMMPYRRPRIEAVSYRETDFVLDFSTIKQDTQVATKTDELKNILVSRYHYAPDDNSSTLFEGSTTETNFHVEWKSPAKNVQITVTGGTLLSSTIYAYAADLVLSSGTKAITITGIKQDEVVDVKTFAANQNGEDDEEENPLISTEEMRAALAVHFITYLGLRSTYDASYRGNPEIEVGDLIQTQTNYTDAMDALVLTDELNYNGTLSGKLKVKGIL